MRKKIIAVLLACMMAASVVPMSVSANGGEGTDPTTGVSTLSEVTVSNENDLITKVANEGTVIKLDQDIKLTKQLNITANVTIDGGGHTLSVAEGVSWPTKNDKKYMVVVSSKAVSSGTGTTIKNLTIDATSTVPNGNASGCLQFYTATGGQISNVTLKNAKQLGLNVNASTVTATGTVTLSGNGWGDIINVSWGSGISGVSECKFGASNATLSGVDQIYSDSGDVNRANGKDKINITVPTGYVATADDDTINYFPAGNVPVVVTNGGTSTNYASLVNAVENAPDGATVTLNKDVTVDSVIKLNNKITLNGGGHSITAGEGVSDNFVTVLEDGTKLEDVKLVAGAASKNVLHIYQAQGVVLTDVSLDHSKAADGAPMIVNASTVTVEGELELTAGEKSWYGINVDAQGKKATLIFNDESKVVFNDNESRSLIKSEGEGTKEVKDNAKVIAARVGNLEGVGYFYSTLQDAVNAVEADKVPNVSTKTITVLRSSETATVKNIQELSFAVADTVTELPQLKDTTTGKTYQVSANGETVEVEDPGTEIPDEETYTVTVDNKVWGEYEEGEKVEIYTAPYTYDGRFFVRWVGDVNFYDAYSNSTTFKMPAKDVDVYAYYTYISYTPVVPDVPDYTPVKPVEPAEPEIEWTREDGNTYLYVDDEMITGWYENEDG